MSDQKVRTTKEINVKIGFNKENVPVKMEWEATDGKGAEETKAMLLSLFHKDTRDTMKIDLWTTEMQVIEMDRFMYQTIRGLADTYLRATNNTKLVNDMRRFAQYFGEETEILPKSS